MATPTKQLVEYYYHTVQEIRVLESFIKTEEIYFAEYGKSDNSVLAIDIQIESMVRLDKLFDSKERLAELLQHKAVLEEELIPRLEVLRENTITNVTVVQNNPIFYYLVLENGCIKIRKER